MAWFSYKCDECGVFRKSLDKREKVQDCPSCGKKSPAFLKVGTVQTVEVLDNGAMARSVERLSNIEEIMEQRADKHSSVNRERLGWDFEDS